MASRTTPTAPSWRCHDRTVSPDPRSHSFKSATDEAYTDDDTKTGHCVEATTAHCGEATTGHCGEAKAGHWLLILEVQRTGTDRAGRPAEARSRKPPCRPSRK